MNQVIVTVRVGLPRNKSEARTGACSWLAALSAPDDSAFVLCSARNRGLYLIAGRSAFWRLEKYVGGTAFTIANSHTIS